MSASASWESRLAISSCSSAEIIAIGSELLTPRFKDTNSLYLTEQLNAIGIPVVMKTIVGDDENYLEQAVRGSLERTPILITIGGLGPTEDDVTRKVVARVLQRQLVLNDEILARLQRRFKARGVEMPANNARQALVLTGSDILENNNGTAPGLWIAAEKNHVILLPGTAVGTEAHVREVVHAAAARNGRRSRPGALRFSHGGPAGIRCSTRESLRSTRSTRIRKPRFSPSPARSKSD